MKRRFILGLGTIVLLFLTGCGTKGGPDMANQKDTNTEVSNAEQPHQWVSDIYGPNTTYYVISDKQITKVDKMLYDLQAKHAVNFAPAYWNKNDKASIQIYVIPGVDTKIAVAVKLTNGTYVEADAVGNKKP